nr:DUF2634 domain-containing protein [Paenibacillus larvae]
MDGLEAIRQAVHKILHTERYEHLIYSPDYGSELTGLIGQAPFMYSPSLSAEFPKLYCRMTVLKKSANSVFPLRRTGFLFLSR